MADSPTSRWTAADLPNLTGRRIVVTGANSGLGLVTATELARCGAEVTMAVRDPARGEVAAAGIRSQHPSAAVGVMTLDLADLASVRSFALAWGEAHPEGLDLLVNNAGVMALPRRQSKDGYELQFATNHLGHFALTGLLLPALVARPRSRVVTVSSGVHRFGRIDFDDLQGRRRYHPWRAYAQSKLANLLFTTELQRNFDSYGITSLSLAAHPGYSATNLQAAGPAMTGRSWLSRPIDATNRILAQSAEMGALPTLFAAAFPGLPGAAYIGPDGFLETRGYPTIVDMATPARNIADARRLWSISEDLTGVHYPWDLS